jgi:serine phosphatase RsbU (regulator of sigma subunit)/anti-sigma regulatory factor (Ser/Thr protein kinase)
MSTMVRTNTSEPQRRIQGVWLILIRLGWVALFLFALYVVFATIPESYDRATTICTPPDCADDQVTQAGMDSLSNLGLSLSFFAWYTIIISVIFALVYVGLAALIFWRRSDDPMAVYVSVTLVLFGTSITDRIIATSGGNIVYEVLVALMPALAWIAFANLLYLFPDGRFVPRWTMALAAIWLSMIILPLTLNRFVSGWVYTVINIDEWHPLVQLTLLFVLFGGGIYAQIYRYRNTSNPVQRQQTKWVVYGLVVLASAVLLVSELPNAVAPELGANGTLLGLLIDAVGLLFLIFMAATFAIAILRYRLWDIDLVIRRTLVYALLSGILALVYFGCILLFEAIRPPLWQERSDLESVIATLVIVALIAPLRWRIQQWIDRRFYRQKYDAEQVLTSLTTQLQREVEMPHLRAALLAAVTETWQPVHGSLWLAAEPDRPASLNGDAPSPLSPSDPLLAYVAQDHPWVELDKVKLDSPAVAALRAEGVQLVAPLISQGDVVGLLNLGPRRSEQEYSHDDLRLLRTLADQAAPALRVAQLVAQQRLEALQRERIEQELRVARIIQETLLPRELPHLDGWRVDAFWQPAQEVGGDFYDFIGLPGGRLGIVIGDVTDKGVPAALVMASTRSILRSAAERHNAPGEVLAYVNNLLIPDMPAKMFVTCLYAIFDPASGHVWIANAGHNLPTIRTKEGVVELRATGMPLGLLAEMTYEEAETTLAPGDALLLYSDGLPEAHDPQRAMYGFPRVRANVAAYHQGEMIGELRRDLADFVGPDWVQEDDVTLVVLERLPAPAGPQEPRDPERTMREILRLSIPSIMGNERPATAQVIEALHAVVSLPRSLVERIQTAVAETLMNAIEHGNQYQVELSADVEVLLSPQQLLIRVTDHGGERPIPTGPDPDLEAKLAGLQSPRGWGLFLIKSMVDEMRIQSDEHHHTVELVFDLTANP